MTMVNLVIVNRTHIGDAGKNSKVCTPIKSLDVDSDLLPFRREKPSILSGHKPSVLIPARTVALSCSMMQERPKNKTPLSTTGKKNAQQIARALKRLSELE
jgi:hypothetical protein